MANLAQAVTQIHQYHSAAGAGGGKLPSGTVKVPSMPEPSTSITARLSLINGFWDRWERWLISAGMSVSILAWLRSEGQQMADAYYALVAQGDPR